MSGLALEPSKYTLWPDCEWCGLRVACCRELATYMCSTCRDGGRVERIKASCLRLRRAAERTD